MNFYRYLNEIYAFYNKNFYKESFNGANSQCHSRLFETDFNFNSHNLYYVAWKHEFKCNKLEIKYGDFVLHYMIVYVKFRDLYSQYVILAVFKF